MNLSRNQKIAIVLLGVAVVLILLGYPVLGIVCLAIAGLVLLFG